MKIIKTKDGSETFYSEKYDENFHSLSGAFDEALKKFIEPTLIQKIKKPKVLDICFGLGYNSCVALDVCDKIEIIALEKDKALLKELNKLKIPEKYKDSFDIIKKASKDLIYSDKNKKIKIVVGDATETIRGIDIEFDAVFLDPFSPPKNPELWSVNFFKNIKKLMKKDAILATYSCARKVRDNLIEAGFEIKDGPVVGRRAPSTLAFHSFSNK